MMMVIMLFEAFMRTRVFRSFSFWSFYVVQSFLVQLKTQGLAFRRTRVFGSSCFKTLRRTVVLRVFWCICSFWKSFLKTRVFTIFFLFFKALTRTRVLRDFWLLSCFSFLLFTRTRVFSVFFQISYGIHSFQNFLVRL